jgi:hypothetical protein
MVKNKKPTNTQIEKTLAIAGTALVILGCIASLFYGYKNQSFINTPIPDLIYYYNYLVLLGGGFAAGYLLTRKGKTRLFSGVAYAFLTMSVYSFMELMRMTFMRQFEALPFLWQGIVFAVGPLFALAIATIIATILQRKPKQIDFSIGAKWILIITFVVTQIYNSAYGFYMTVINPANNDQYAMPMWLAIGDYLVNPILIILVAYLLLSQVKNSFQRLFYSVFVGSFSYVLFLVLWKFRTDPSLDATNNFETVLIIVTILATSFLLWRARLATRH